MKMIFHRAAWTALILGAIAVWCGSVRSAQAGQSWTHRVRIAAYPLALDRVDSIMKNVEETHVYGIEVDNDITGRYSSFLHPQRKLAAIKAIAERAHEAGNHAFVYISGLECITAHADKRKHTLFKDHPDWVQRNIKGQPAVFGNGIAFWVSPGDEDAWVSPYAEPWRTIYMKRVRQIAATGIDGIYVDIPYWMTHYPGWDSTWASFDKYTVAAFRKETGLNAMKDVKIGDFSNPAFVQWVKFRIRTITEFLEEIDENIKSVNPHCKLIPEIYPGLGRPAVSVGADVYQIAKVSDVITHEYHVGKVYSAQRKPFNWINFITGIRTFGAFAEGKPTWVLSYSWYKNKGVRPAEAMKSLFASELFSGAHTWDAKGYIMSSSNDMSTRREVYKWIAQNENVLFGQSSADSTQVGLFFSPSTRDMFPREYVKSYRGMAALLMNAHINFQIVTPRTLDRFAGKLLIFDNVQCASYGTIHTLDELLEEGRKFLVTGNSFAFDADRVLMHGSVLRNLFNVVDTSRNELTSRAVYAHGDPGMRYYSAMKTYFNESLNGSEAGGAALRDLRSGFLRELKGYFNYTPQIGIEAPASVLSYSQRSESGMKVNLVDVGQLCSACKGRQVRDSIYVKYKRTAGSPEVTVTPFMGKSYKLTARFRGCFCRLALPPFNRFEVLSISKE